MSYDVCGQLLLVITADSLGSQAAASRTSVFLVVCRIKNSLRLCGYPRWCEGRLMGYVYVSWLAPRLNQWQLERGLISSC